MGIPYDHREVERRWQARWDADRLYEVDVDSVDADEVFYNLVEFPYPSAEGLHVGHVFKYCGADVLGRYQRMRGKAVFQPIGFDSFGINAENYALKIGDQPRALIERTTANFRRQLSSVGIAWDWSRSLTTSDPAYYRWTQWVFVQLFRAGLAYQEEAPVTWCPSCLTVLAKEQLEDDRCERCDSEVGERVLRQWFLRTTAYADRLVKGLEQLDWPLSAKRKQHNWIREADGSLRLHDWLISRQRYWGSPIPIVHCGDCGAVPVPEDQLPVVLPDTDDFHPTGTGRSPLAAIEAWVVTSCPQCGAEARRETDVADTFVESSWYFLRYPSTDVVDAPWDADRTRRVLPVDFYAGGPEHVTRHHLYARFVTMALHDLGLIGFSEPFPDMRLGGIVHQDGSRMSKSKGNVVDPDRYIDEHGGDVLRLHLLFSAPWEGSGDYRSEGIAGIERFLTRVWRLVDGHRSDETSAADTAPTIERVRDAIEKLRFNVGIAALMELVNVLEREGCSSRHRRELVLLLAPFAPYVAEELWSRLGGEYSVHTQRWPEVVREPATEVDVVVQVDGRKRGVIRMAAGLDVDSARAVALASDVVRRSIDGAAVVRVVVVADRLVNVVTGRDRDADD